MTTATHRLGGIVLKRTTNFLIAWLSKYDPDPRGWRLEQFGVLLDWLSYGRQPHGFGSIVLACCACGDEATSTSIFDFPGWQLVGNVVCPDCPELL